MELEDYAKRVLFYVRNPGKEPMIEVMSEEEAREAGMPSAGECVLLLDRAIDDAEQEEKAHYAGFDDDEKSAATTTGGTARKRAPKIGEARGAVFGEESLAQDVTEERRRHASGGVRAEVARKSDEQGGKGADAKTNPARPAAKKPRKT